MIFTLLQMAYIVVYSTDRQVKEALLRALFNITMKVGDKISEENKHNIIEVYSFLDKIIDQNMIFCVSDKEEVIRSISATIVGVILKHLKEEDKTHVFDVLLHVNSSSSWEERHGQYVEEGEEGIEVQLLGDCCLYSIFK